MVQLEYKKYYDLGKWMGINEIQLFEILNGCKEQSLWIYPKVISEAI